MNKIILMRHNYCISWVKYSFVIAVTRQGVELSSKLPYMVKVSLVCWQPTYIATIMLFLHTPTFVPSVGVQKWVHHKFTQRHWKATFTYTCPVHEGLAILTRLSTQLVVRPSSPCVCWNSMIAGLYCQQAGEVWVWKLQACWCLACEGWQAESIFGMGMGRC